MGLEYHLAGFQKVSRMVMGQGKKKNIFILSQTFISVVILYDF